MYQDNSNVMMNGVCTSTFDNNYPPSSWIQGTNRHSPPPPLVMVKQEQPQDLNGMPPTTSMNGYYANMCQPLMLDDSSPPACDGPLLLSPSPTDVFSQSNSSSPTMDDQWFDLYSPIQSHCTYPMEQRLSFDQSMFINNNNNNMIPHFEDPNTDCPMYCCNTNANATTHYEMESPIPSPSSSYSTLSYHPYYNSTNRMAPRPSMPAVPRHQSMPSLYYYQQQQPLSTSSPPSTSPTSSSSLSSPPSGSSSSTAATTGLGLGLGLGFGSESEPPLRPYQCHLCSRGFARKHDLQRHIRVHTGDKPYACLCCEKAFARTDALKRHLRMEDHCRNSPQIQNMKNTGKRRYKNL